MGRPKALLTAGERTFVRRILDTLREGGVSHAAVVVRAATAQPVTREVELARFGCVLVNPDPDRGQLSSLLVALDAVDIHAVDAVLVTLVDVPLVKPETVASLLAHGRHGHPVIFKRDVFGALRAADLAVGARAVLRTHEVENVEVDDAGVCVDVDTPDDYGRLTPP